MSKSHGNHLNVTKSWHEMLEAEGAALPLRVFDLEKLVRDQQDEITFLKSTVADLQRRLNVVDGARAVSKLTSVQSPMRPSPQRLGNGLHGGYDRADGPRRRPMTAQKSRRPYHHQSTGSLHSDGHSSNSVSPVASPSPTYGHQRHLANRAAPLNKRWSSTSDFQPAHRAPAASPSPTATVSLRRTGQTPRGRRPESYAGTGYVLFEEPLDLWRPNDNRDGTLISRRPLGGSLSNLNRAVVPRGTGTKDMSYNADDGVLKIFLRGRPVNLYAPSSVREEYNVNGANPAPQRKLKLEWAYGYRGKDCRNNLYLLPTGEMVYFVAGVVVLYNVEDQMQRHYTAHTDDVKCLAVHPNRFTIASGQCSGTKADAQAQVHVWDSVSLNTLHVLGAGDLERSVSCVAFSQLDGGSLLACVDEGQERTLSVWEWQRAAKVTENKASLETVVDVQWHPLDRGVLMTCGRQHVNFWLLEAGSLMRRQGVFGGRDRPKYVTCMAFTDTGDLITGDSEGRILLWERGGNQVARTIKNAHDGALFTLLVDKTGNIISGGKDGKIVQWDRALSRTGSVLELPEEFGAPRIVSQGRGCQLLIGTTRNCILAGDWTVLPRLVARGHTDEVWAAAVHPGRPQFVTGAWDGHLLVWDVMTHAPVWELGLGEGIQCAAFSPDGSQLAVGLVTGRWDVLDADTRETVFSRSDGAEPIQAVAFSPDGRMVALGSRNNTVYIYQATDGGFARVAKCTGHSSFVTHLDWSADSAFLRTNSGDYELLYWTAATGRQLTQPSQMRDTEWATHTCTLAFNSIGIYPEAADGTDVNTCCKSHRGHLMASGDDFGKVKLFGYPANKAKSHHQSCRGHSSHVTHVQFFSEDDRLLSAGGRDMAVLQWTVE
ncbi:echinoderm microtubule-associated protein-like 2 isoform X2 [Pollicipes pollicipes]|uniref:echinoderm microtubule-associated protein-like 2 isoform X2 n=1 Tax=Pollicipes pollicipes TaxID=41117 RepID=UPI0018856C8F|nr:echinoderm microtubule-associated protein-like 2 isoform X2 [Pollicipes pollicipes]XP_037083885.1 echinoderm microtubule-associated protein-like 2 isoform X2 [Pollicipes pollicipes]